MYTEVKRIIRPFITTDTGYERTLFSEVLNIIVAPNQSRGLWQSRDEGKFYIGSDESPHASYGYFFSFRKYKWNRHASTAGRIPTLVL